MKYCLWTLTCASIGLACSAALSVSLPHHLFSAEISAIELLHAIEAFRGLQAKAGDTRALLGHVSKTDIALRGGAAACCKLVLLLSAGHDVEAWLHGQGEGPHMATAIFASPAGEGAGLATGGKVVVPHGKNGTSANAGSEITTASVATVDALLDAAYQAIRLQGGITLGQRDSR